MKEKNSSYNQILRATSIFGSSQVVNILLGVVRTKVIALLLGVGGVGLIGVYQSVVDMIRSIAGLGFETGVVKDIAQTENEEAQAKEISIFSRLFIYIAGLGVLLCLALCIPISYWMFDDFGHILPIALLSIAVFFTILALGRNAILQGMRRISFLAKATIAYGIISLVVTSLVYFLKGVTGIIPVFIINSLILFFCSNYYYKKLKKTKRGSTHQEVIEKGIQTFRLGKYILLGSIIAGVSMFLIRVILMNELSESATGLFQSAWALTSVFTSLILGAAGTDYFPRLCALKDDIVGIKKLVNEQLYIVLLLSAPLALGLLLYAKPILTLFYSSEFTEAHLILYWQAIGAFLKIVATPLAMILLAKGKGKLYLISEAVYFGIYLLLTFFLLPHMGLEITGFGYFIAYLAYFLVILIMAKSVSSFKWKKNTSISFLINLTILAIGFTIVTIEPSFNQLIRVVLFLLSIGFSFYMLLRVFSLREITAWFKRKKDV